MKSLCLKVEEFRQQKTEEIAPIEEMDENLYNIMNERLNEDPNTTAKFGKSSTKKDPIKKNKERVQSVNTKKK